MPRPFRLKRPIGPDSNMDLDDVLNTKRALRDMGHFRNPKFGLTPYPDEPMIEGVKSFQRRHGLRVDGVMKPDGPTIKRLNDTLAQRQPASRPPNPLSKRPLPPRRGLLDTVPKPSELESIQPSVLSAATRSSSSQPSPKPPSTKPKDEKQVAAAPAAAAAAIPLIPELPAIIGAIAGMLGLTLPLKGDTRPDDKCDKQLKEDLARCSQIARGNREIYRRCEKTAMARFANCIAGRPLGPLDEGM